MSDNPFYMLSIESKLDPTLLDTIDSVQCLGAFEQFLLFAIGSHNDSSILPTLLHFYLRSFSSHQDFLRLLVDTEIRLGSHPSLLARELSSHPHCAHELFRILESTLHQESEFVKVAGIICRFLLHTTGELSEDSFLSLLSIGLHAWEMQSPVYWIAQNVLSSFLCVWNRGMNRTVHPFIQSAFELLGFPDLEADSAMKLPDDGSFIGQLLSLMAAKRIDELRKICEVSQSFEISICLCSEDSSIVQAAASNLSKRIDPLYVLFPIFSYLSNNIWLNR